SLIIKKKPKANPTDRLVCDICGKGYSRRNRAQHQKSKICQAFLKANNAIKSAVLSTHESTTLKEKLKHQYYDNNGKVVYLTDYQYKLHCENPKNKYIPV
ncbi:MAG TPA: hypothetical protein VIY08_00835, partial [Candidatus Nitrosocosmicus sp.]